MTVSFDYLLCAHNFFTLDKLQIAWLTKLENITLVGRKGVNLNCLSFVASMNVPKNSRTEKKKMSGT